MAKNRLADKFTTGGKRSLIFLFLFLAFVLPGSSQGYLVHHYTETDGLPNSTVQDILQDQSGRIWFATRAGISCYDGLTWENYSITHGLQTTSFIRIAVDRRGRIFGLADSGYGISVVFRSGSADAPWSQIAVRAGDFYGFMEMTSFCLVEQEDFPVIAVGTSNHGLFLRQGNRWTHITEKDGLISNSVNGLVCLGDKLYVATNSGLFVITITNTPTISNRLNQAMAFPSKEIKGITLEEKGRYPDCQLKNTKIWICGYHWLGYFEENNTRLTIYRAEGLMWEKKKTIYLLPDYRSGLYMGQWQKLHYFNYKSHTWEKLGVSNGLISDGANALSIDFEKNIWIGCNRGVSKISSRRFSNLYKINGLLEDEVTAVLETDPGKIILGHNRGVTFYDGRDFTTMRLPQKEGFRIPVSRVLDIQPDSKKNLWLALAWSGLGRIDAQRRITLYGEKEGLPVNIICLWVDQRDNVWIGTQEGIYYHQPGKGFESWNTGKYRKISARRIYGSQGKLRYIASHNNGLYVNRENQWQNYRLPGSHKANSIYSVTRDSRGRLLLGTLDGVYTLKEEKLEKFKVGYFQVDRPVYFILEDKRNRLWFGIDKGVIRWDGKRERRYSVSEGLSGQETNRAAGFVDSKGRVWIGTNSGVSIYNEEFDDRASFNPAPKIQLLYLEVIDRKIPFTHTRPIRLKSKENTIAIFFRGLSFLNEAMVRFKSKLDGFESEWSDEKYLSNQVIRYTSLPAGTYRFQLKARNGLGIWSDVVTSPAITILKPFYRRWWFFLAAFLAAGLFFYGIFRFFSEKRNAALLEKKVHERTRQLEEMQQQLIQSQKMEAVGTLAGGIAHDFNNILGIIVGNAEMMLTDLAEGAPTRHSAETILTAAERAAGLVRQILTFSRQSRQERKPLKLGIILKETLKLLRSSLPTTIEIRQNIRTDGDFVLADLTQIHQVIMNLGANAAHAMREKGGVLEVSLDNVYLDSQSVKTYHNIKSGNYLRLTVSDTGQGMSATVRKRIFEPFFTTKRTGEGTGMGLAVVHGIVKSHAGDITVYSKPGKGTTFQVLLPRIEDTDEPKKELTEELPGGSERILLVDDEAALAQVGREILGRLGYQVVGKADAVEALETFRRNPQRFDLLITDLTMPNMTGIQLAEEVRRIRPDIPIIFCSGFSAVFTDERIKHFGTDNFVMKPVIKRDLAMIVRNVLDKKK